MTKERMLKMEYGNVKLKISPNANISVYKCPRLSCDKFYFSQDDLDRHRILNHAEMPKSLTKMDSQKRNRYFSKSSMYRLNGKFQREQLKHVLMILNFDMDKFSKSFIGRIKRWYNARRAGI